MGDMMERVVLWTSVVGLFTMITTGIWVAVLSLSEVGQREATLSLVGFVHWDYIRALIGMYVPIAFWYFLCSRWEE